MTDARAIKKMLKDLDKDRLRVIRQLLKANDTIVWDLVSGINKLARA